MTAVALCDVTSVALFHGCRSTSVAVFDVTAVAVVERFKYLCYGFFGCACTSNVLSRGNGPSIRKLIDENGTCPQHEQNGDKLLILFVCLFCFVLMFETNSDSYQNSTLQSASNSRVPLSTVIPPTHIYSCCAIKHSLRGPLLPGDLHVERATALPSIAADMKPV